MELVIWVIIVLVVKGFLKSAKQNKTEGVPPVRRSMPTMPSTANTQNQSMQNQTTTTTFNRQVQNMDTPVNNNQTLVDSSAAYINEAAAEDRRYNKYNDFLIKYRYDDARDIAAELAIPESQVFKDIRNYKKKGYYKNVSYNISTHKIMYNEALVKKEETKSRADIEYEKRHEDLKNDELKHWAYDEMEDEEVLDVNYGIFSSYDFNPYNYLPTYNTYDYIINFEDRFLKNE